MQGTICSLDRIKNLLVVAGDGVKFFKISDDQLSEVFKYTKYNERRDLSTLSVSNLKSFKDGSFAYQESETRDLKLFNPNGEDVRNWDGEPEESSNKKA